MEQYIPKSALVAEIKNLIERAEAERVLYPKTIRAAKNYLLIEDYKKLLSIIDTLEVKDPYEQCIQYASIEGGIKAHAETYSFNIESELFQQLTKEQQKLWRKEIEQAVISGGDAGVELARDPRYKENLEVEEVDLQSEIDRVWDNSSDNFSEDGWKEFEDIAKHFFELGMTVGNKAQKGEKV